MSKCKSKVFAVILCLSLLLQTVICGISVSAADVEKIDFLQPIFSADEQTVNTGKTILTKTGISSFTSEFDYTVKENSKLSLLYNISNEKVKSQSWDFTDSTVTAGVSLKSGEGTIENRLWGSSNALVFAPTSASGVTSTNIIENAGDFDISFLYKHAHWTMARVHMRGGKLQLLLKGNGNSSSCTKSPVELFDVANNNLKYLMPEDLAVEGKYPNPENQVIRIKAVGTNVKVYIASQLVIDATVSEECGNATGGIYFSSDKNTNNWGISNFSVNEYADMYYSLDIGTEVALSRITDKNEAVATSETTLTAGQTYKIRTVNNNGNLKVYADGSLIFETTVTYPYTFIDDILWQGQIGLTATANDSVANLNVWDSPTVKDENGLFTYIDPIQTGVKESLAITAQSSWTSAANGYTPNASITITDGDAAITSPSATNSRVQTDSLLATDSADVYVRFKAEKSRTNYTWDRFYFADYQFDINSTGSWAVTDPTGMQVANNNLITNEAQTAYTYCGSGSAHIIEFVKKGKNVDIYYYPEGSERTLFYSGSDSKATSTELNVLNFQGTLYIRDFTAYDAVPTDAVTRPALNEYSAYIKNGTDITNVPEGITVAELKSNFLGVDNAVIYADSAKTVILEDTDIITDGAYVYYDVLKIGYNIITSPADEITSRSLLGNQLLEHCKVVGRPVLIEDVGVGMEWSNASITLGGRISGDVEVVIARSGQYYDFETGINVVIDNDHKTVKFTAFENTETDVTYKVATGLTEGNHTVQIMKNHESQNGTYVIKAIKFNGTPVRPKDSERKIEFLGDSITGGCGIYVQTESAWSHHSYYTYASVASRLLGADYYGVANSGWGFAGYLKGSSTITRVYESTTNAIQPSSPHDFSSWTPDVVVINLGTNDNTVIRNVINAEEGKYTAEEIASFTSKDSYKNAVKNLVNIVRKNNPNATIIWSYGAMDFGVTIDGQRTGEWIAEAIEELAEADNNVYFHRMNHLSSGGGNHPDKISSDYLGKTLAEFISKIKGWDYVSESNRQYENGEIIAEYDFEEADEAPLTANMDEYISYTNGVMNILASNNASTFGGNVQVRSSGLASNGKLKDYELTFDYQHTNAAHWNRDAILLRSPGGATTNAIYLAFFGGTPESESDTASGGINSYMNSTGDKVNAIQLVSAKEGTVTKLAAIPRSTADLLNKSAWTINVKIEGNSIECTMWQKGTEKPATPTFSVDLSEYDTVDCGDIYFQGHSTSYAIDNIKLTAITDGTHTHSFTKQSFDRYNHWTECACGAKTDIAAHTVVFGDEIAATNVINGHTRSDSCSVCGNTVYSGDIIPATNPVTGITSELDGISLAVGKLNTLNAQITANDNSIYSIEWAVTNGSARLEDGLLSVLLGGELTVTATVKNGKLGGGDFVKEFNITSYYDGDTNGDNTTDIRDLIRTKKQIAANGTVEQYPASNVDGSTDITAKLNAADLAALAKMLLK